MARAIKYLAAVGASGLDSLDLMPLVMAGDITQAPTLFIDNSRNSASFVVATSNVLQSIEIPAFSQAVLPLLLANPGAIAFGSNGGVDVPVYVYAWPMPAATWFAPALGITLLSQAGAPILAESGAAIIPEG